MTGDPPVQDEIQEVDPDSQDASVEPLHTDPQVSGVQAERAMDPTGSVTPATLPGDGTDAAVSDPPGSMPEQHGIVTPL